MGAKPQNDSKVLISVKLEKTQENDALLGDLESIQFDYDENHGQYRFRASANSIEVIRDAFKSFVQKARNEYRW